MSIDLDELEQLAKTCTPGPWKWEAPFDPERTSNLHSHRPGLTEDDVESYQSIIVTDSGCYPPFGADRDYIAAVSPDVVLELIAEVRQLKDQRDLYFARYLSTLSYVLGPSMRVSTLHDRYDEAYRLLGEAATMYDKESREDDGGRSYPAVLRTFLDERREKDAADYKREWVK